MARVNELYAFVDDDDIVGLRTADNWQPLVTTDPEDADSLRPIARRIAHDSHRTVRLVRFTATEEIPL